MTGDELKELLTTEGEIFQQVCACMHHIKCYTSCSNGIIIVVQEEIDEMLQAAVDPDKGVVLYHEYVRMMLPEEGQNS